MEIVKIISSIFFLTVAAFSQTQIFSIPSTETQDKGKPYVETYYTTHIAHYRNGGFNELSPRLIYGVSENVEVGFNYVFSSSEDGITSEFQPNVKWQAFKNKRGDVNIAVGGIAFIPVGRCNDAVPAVMIYANASKTFEKARSLKLTGGLYQIAGGGRDYGTKNGVMAGLEQPLDKAGKFTVLIDWLSGNNDLGYSNAGLQIALKEKHYITAGYTFGNFGRSNNGLVVAYGYSF